MEPWGAPIRRKARSPSPPPLTSHLILPSLGHGLRDLVEERALSEDVNLSTVIDIDTYGQIKLLVEGGLGYSILPGAALREETAKGALRTWPMGDPVLSRDLYLVRPADRPLTNAVRAIEELAYATLVRLVNEGVWPAIWWRSSPPPDAEAITSAYGPQVKIVF